MAQRPIETIETHIWKGLGQLVLVTVIGWLLFMGTALASAPQIKTQAPGYYRIMVGNFVVTALFDGNFALNADKLLLYTSKAHVNKVLAWHFLKSPVPTSVNGYLINTGKKLVLVDTGCGSLFGPSLGKLVRNLKAAGYAPSQVDDIYLTHMHPDHVGGLTADGKRVFANATVHAAKQDADYWLNENKLKTAPKNDRGFFKDAMVSLNPYIKAGKFKTFDGKTRLMPGIEAIPAPGHTPGHTMYRVRSEGHTLLLWGDIVHVASVQFPDPSIAIKFDSNPKEAVATRKKVFKAVVRSGELIGGAHLAFPGLGHLRKAHRGYTFIPVDYLGSVGH